MNAEEVILTPAVKENEMSEKETLNFLNIPEELQLQIFSYLTPNELSTIVAPVCRKFWRLSKDTSLWKDLTLKITSEEKCKSCCAVFQRCHLLNSLKVRSSIPITHILDSFVSLSQIKNLDLKDCKGLDGNAFHTIASNCPLIENLNLKNCNSVNGIQHGIQNIVSLLNLQYLNLSNCFDVDDTCMTLIARNCCKLKLLNVNGVTITDVAVSELSQHRSETLQHLYLDGTNLTDDSMVFISSCKNLVTFKVKFGKRFTERTLIALSTLPHLTSFKLHGSRNLTPEALGRFFLSPRLKFLKDLELEHIRIDDVCLQNLSQTSRNLKRLRLLSCKTFSDLGLKYVFENCENLCHLDLFRSYNLTGKTLALIPSKLPNMMELHLGICINISHAIILDLVRKMPQLKVYAHFGHQVKATS